MPRQAVALSENASRYELIDKAGLRQTCQNKWIDNGANRVLQVSCPTWFTLSINRWAWRLHRGSCARRWLECQSVL